ncbi:MAG: sugar phosphate isomerase/epimerase [Methanosarcinaceae archaeon]|nr:sugar phosphate isomerase/epimerase [Methanosarcinaceae archaeon]
MRIKRISFSSRVTVENPFCWVYTLEDLGFTGWEIVQDGVQSLNTGTLMEVKKIQETTNLELTLHLPFSDLNLGTLNPGISQEVRRQMMSNIELASDFVELAVVHPGYLSPYGVLVPELAWRANVDSLQLICDFAADYGILVAVENMPDVPNVFGKCPLEILRMTEEVSCENIGFTFDVGHANTMGVVDDFLDECLGMVSHVHLHDNMGKKDEHLPVGKGSVDWKTVMHRLSSFKGSFVTEVNSVEEGVESLAFLKGLLF